MNRPEIISTASILNHVQMRVITLMYRDGLTQTEVSVAIGIPQQTISRIHRNAIKRMAYHAKQRKSLIFDFVG